MHKILTKWIEPYVVLESIKSKCELIKVLKFDGFSKNNEKKEFLKQLQSPDFFGLYMKNVNNFYLFKGNIDIVSEFNLESSDYELTDDIEKPFIMVDMGKAEAGFLSNINNTLQ